MAKQIKLKGKFKTTKNAFRQEDFTKYLRRRPAERKIAELRSRETRSTRAVEPPEIPHTRERRILKASEVRVVKTPGKPDKLVGYAAVFNQLSVPLQTKSGKKFVEKIDPGFFQRSLDAAKSGDAEMALFHAHNPNDILARTSAKTLRMEEDPKGLKFEADLPGTNLARDVAADVEHGNIPGMSFGFDDAVDEWEKGKDGTFIRTLKDGIVGEISTTPWPAYEGTSVENRSIDVAIERLEKGQPAGTAEERCGGYYDAPSSSIRSACRSAQMSCRDAHDSMENALHTIATRANNPNEHELRAMRDMMSHVRNVRRKAEELRSTVKALDSNEPDDDDLPPANPAATAGQNANQPAAGELADGSAIAILAAATSDCGLSPEEARALLPVGKKDTETTATKEIVN